MATFQADEWSPRFHILRPAHWAALVATTDGIRVLADEPPSTHAVHWLRRWFASYDTALYVEGEASYVFVALDEGWWRSEPDGVKRDGGVLGLGSGAHLDEPPGAAMSTVNAIVADFCTTEPREHGEAP